MLHDLTHDEVQTFWKTARALLDSGKKFEAVRNHFSLLDENHNPRFSAEELHVLLAWHPNAILPDAPVGRILPTTFPLAVPAGDVFPAPNFLQDLPPCEAWPSDTGILLDLPSGEVAPTDFGPHTDMLLWIAGISSRASNLLAELLTALARIDRGVESPPTSTVQSVPVPPNTRLGPPTLPFPAAGDRVLPSPKPPVQGEGKVSLLFWPK